MVSQALINRHRAHQERFMPSSCAVLRKTDGARDQFGDRGETWATVATVPCRIAVKRPAGGENVTGFMAATSVVEYTLTLPWDSIEIRSTDRIICGGATYEVNGQVEALSYESAQRVTLTRLERGE